MAVNPIQIQKFLKGVDYPASKSDRDDAHLLQRPSRMTALRHSAILSKTPVKEGEAPLALNVNKPVWLPREKAAL